MELSENESIQKSIHVFIISWMNQHQNATSIANKLSPAADHVSIVYSDPDPHLFIDTECEAIKRPNNLFWGDKFKTCLDTCQSKLMLVIHADCICDDWQHLVTKCVTDFKENQQIAVWAPFVSGSSHPLETTQIFQLPDSPLYVTAQTDGLVFCLSRHSQERMRKADYSENVYGWGIDWLFNAHAFSTNRLVVVDSSISVKHPKERGYETRDARSQKEAFLKQFSPTEMAQLRMSQSHMNIRRQASKKLAKSSWLNYFKKR